MENEIVIAGAGIGGLTLACALEKKGINFQLYEQADSFEALGYGIQVSPNVVRVLRELGLEQKLAEISHVCSGFELRSFNSDRVLAKWRLNSQVPYYQCRRADLHQLLFDSIQDKSKIHFSKRLISYEKQEKQLILHIKNQEPVATKILVAADGVRSVVRESLFPKYKPKYAGYAAFRAILPFESKYEMLLGKATVWMGKNHHVVVYPNGNEQAGKSWLNLVLIVKDQKWSEQGWKTAANKREVAQEFTNKSPLLNEILEDMIASPEPCFKWGLFIHQPLPYWSESKVTLLGDAAHPMVPFQAQGAAMAIEDAYVLAECLAHENTKEKALLKYQKIRLKRTAKVQQVSKNNANFFHASGLKAVIRNVVFSLMSAINPNLFNKKSAWIYDYDATRIC